MSLGGIGEVLDWIERWLGPRSMKWLARLIALAIALGCADFIGSLLGWPLIQLVAALPDGIGATVPYIGDVISGLLGAVGSAGLFYWLSGIRSRRNMARAEAMLEEARQMKFSLYSRAARIDDMVPHVLSRAEEAVAVAEQAIAVVTVATEAEKPK